MCLITFWSNSQMFVLLHVFQNDMLRCFECVQTFLKKRKKKCCVTPKA